MQTARIPAKQERTFIRPASGPKRRAIFHVFFFFCDGDDNDSLAALHKAQAPFRNSRAHHLAGGGAGGHVVVLPLFPRERAIHVGKPRHRGQERTPCRAVPQQCAADRRPATSRRLTPAMIGRRGGGGGGRLSGVVVPRPTAAPRKRAHLRLSVRPHSACVSGLAAEVPLA